MLWVSKSSVICYEFNEFMIDNIWWNNWKKIIKKHIIERAMSCLLLKIRHLCFQVAEALILMATRDLFMFCHAVHYLTFTKSAPIKMLTLFCLHLTIFFFTPVIAILNHSFQPQLNIIFFLLLYLDCGFGCFSVFIFFFFFYLQCLHNADGTWWLSDFILQLLM